MKSATRRSTGTHPNPLGRLAEILRSNDDLSAALKGHHRKLARALSYLDDPQSDRRLGEALVDHAQRGFDRVEARLRANRAEALAILAGRPS